ncbi:hypothetical protein [Prescottella agglutinans]|uniref:Nicotinamide riboside transporter PnuC n=1 Tax=Prescottella agglutinans TaxID=1644129 RepID=A0ABT6MET3_9NOCA|nr:hypothetical protein [Prescottella agglutinans]MDH6282829.1 nicotinamide riboside transporter PnuC [Prescottella agglutinans]
MIPVWWSILLAVVGVFGLYLTTLGDRVRWYGYAVGLGVQLLWITYAVATSQPGFILSALAYGAVNGIGLYRWRKQAKESA